MSPFLEKAWQNDLDFIETNMDASQIHAKDETGYTLLHIAAAVGNLAMAELALQFGTDVNVVENGGKTALMLAANSDALEVAELLLARGAEINRKDDVSDSTALFESAYSSGPALFKRLLDAGADIGAKSYDASDVMDYCLKEQAIELGYHESEDENGDFEPVFFKFARGRNFRSAEELSAFSASESAKVSVLLDSGFPLERVNKHGNTPLMSAVMLNRTGIVEVLAARNADQSVKDNKGRTVNDWALKWRNEKIVSLLKNRDHR